jgi:methyl-accepting chemotaxis protein
MNWFANITIKWKIIYSFAAMIACLGLVIFSALSTIDNLQKDMQTALDARSQRNNANIMRQDMLEALMDNPKDPTYLVRQHHLLSDIDDTTKKMRSGINNLKIAYAGDTKAQSILATLEQAFDAYTTLRDNREIPLLRQGNIDEAKTLSMSTQLASFKALREGAAQLAKHAQDIADERARKAMVSCVVVGMIAILFGIFLSILLDRLLAAPLSEITRAADRLSVGDLDLELSAADRQDEVGSLSRSFFVLIRSWKEMADVAEQVADGDLEVNISPRSDKDQFVIAFNQMVQNMSVVTGQFRDAVQVVSTVASEILAAVNESAAGATQTATAATQTTTIVEEVRQTSHVANEKARQVSESAQRTAQMTTIGRQATQGLIDGMKRIREQVDLIAESMVRLGEKTQSISGIITTVDDLAKQSNLLAVNASIEAARAGDVGKGFSVVAQEVKSMAEQSKQSTLQIRSILTEIQHGTNAATMATELGGKVVDAAVQQSSQAGETISFLASSVVESAQAASQIAVSSQQQLTGVDEVAHAMSGIRDACGEHLVAIKQVEMAAHRLNEIGQKLKDVVEGYQKWDRRKESLRAFKTSGSRN